MKNFWIIFDLVLSVFLGFYINLHITSNLVAHFFSGYNSVYILEFYLFLIMQILLIFSMIRLFKNKKIDRNLFRVIIGVYALLMIVLLFGRQVMDTTINLNPIDLIKFKDKSTFLQNILNIIFFFPIGYLIKNIDLKKAIPYSLIGIFSIELIQLVTRRGFFDIDDIILNMIGIFICYYVSKKFKLELVSK
ncbi:MAG TPA: VanZ family protein [Candidatus Paceibacterota bacterium]